ncbi:MAG: TIGR03960 family B12-binding radical SAM protein [Desulfobacteraceae bacterium]|jgi:radical SAM family uncharacterized protein/radical SAM-linked protein
MPVKTIEDLLPFVQKPSRYLGTEVNRIKKNPDTVKLNMALAFPDLYDIGTSHFGIQILYNLLNGHNDILAERVFAPAQDMEALLREHRLPLPSMESRRPLSHFDILGFSLLYELNFTNVLNMIDLGQIPIRWKDRDLSHPFIIAGGPSVCNPEPMADFFDAMVFGDGENVALKMAEAWMVWRKEGQKDKEALLEQWSSLEGVYVPSFFEAGYDQKGFQRLSPPKKGEPLIQRAIVENMDGASFPEHPIIPFGKPIHDRLRMEISRGCTRGCRFCQAGMIYRPLRERSPGTLLELIKTALADTGYEDLSLLSLSTGDYTCLTPLMEKLMQLCQINRVAVSLPSLRAGSLSPALMELIRSVRKTGFTIAPEAGSQRLRDVINKNITYEDVENTVKDAFELGWHVIKLYFMIGLPTETDEDLDAIVEMVRKLKKIKGSPKRKRKINVSITTFVPKPHTPFQWARQISLDEANRKIQYLKKKLHIPGVQVKWQRPPMSVLEGILARGDRRLSALIEMAWKKGCIFDGWNDQFNFELWQQAMEQCGLKPDFFTTRSRDLDEPLPWSHMDVKVSPDFFKDQWQAAHNMQSLDDCRYGNCHRCGVCDFKSVEPKVFDTFSTEETPAEKVGETQSGTFVWYCLKYTKLGEARFFGHLELSHIFSRAIRRAQIDVEYSKGFHPMPKISFDDPLPLGIESEAEYMRILVSSWHQCNEIIKHLNDHLPDGIRILNCQLRSEAKKERAYQVQCFSIELVKQDFDHNLVDEFKNSATWPYERTNHKGRIHHIDLKKAVKKMITRGKRTVIYEIAPQCEHTIRPADIMAGIFKMPIDVLQGAKVVKRDSSSSKRAVDNDFPEDTFFLNLI